MEETTSERRVPQFPLFPASRAVRVTVSLRAESLSPFSKGCSFTQLSHSHGMQMHSTDYIHEYTQYTSKGIQKIFDLSTWSNRYSHHSYIHQRRAQTVCRGPWPHAPDAMRQIDVLPQRRKGGALTAAPGRLHGHGQILPQPHE